MKKQNILIYLFAGWHGYKRHKTRLWLVRNQFSTIFAEEDMLNVILK